MAQIRGTAGYHLGSGNNANPNHGGGMMNNSFGSGPSSSSATNDPSPLDAIREQTSKLEDLLDTYSDPLKPYLPAIGRFLIVVTFLEDALRIITQWSDQLEYLHTYRYSESAPATLHAQHLWGNRADNKRLQCRGASTTCSS